MSGNLRKLVTWALEANLAFLAIDMLIFVLIWLFQGIDLLSAARGFLPATLLVEAAIVFIVGGLIPMGSTIFMNRVRKHFFRSGEEWSADKYRESEKKANCLILTGVFLFLDSIIASVLLL